MSHFATCASASSSYQLQHMQQDNDQEFVAVAIPLDVDPMGYPNKPQPGPAATSTSTVTSDQYARAPETPPPQQPAIMPSENPPNWLAAFVAMLLYHVLSFAHCLVSMVLCFTTVCFSILLLPFCGLGLVFYRLHVLVVDLLLSIEIRLHNWTVKMVHRHNLLLDVPPINTSFLPQSDHERGAKHLRRFCNCKSLAKTLYFGVFKWVLVFVHIFSAVFVPVTTFMSLFVGGHGMGPVASVCLQLTRYVTQRYA